jgi:hypothetical protein
MLKEITKCDFDPKDLSESFFIGVSGRKISIIDLGGPRKVNDDVRGYLTRLCNNNNVDESEIKFYDDRDRMQEEDDRCMNYEFRIYFRGYQFLFSDDFFWNMKFEDLQKEFEKFLKMNVDEINEVIEMNLREERRRNSYPSGSGMGDSWLNRPDDEDYCTGEYSWNID